MQGIALTRHMLINQIVVPQKGDLYGKRAIGGTISRNWKQLPIRGQAIMCPLEMTLENIVVQIANYVWQMLKWMLNTVCNILNNRITTQKTDQERDPCLKG